METKTPQVTAIYFSATDTTRKCIAEVANSFAQETLKEINLADNLDADLPEFKENDIVIVGSPVYGGRLPRTVSKALQSLRGNNARAIAIVVYGNRDYDDALLELTDLLTANAFRIIGHGAFIGQHSIFPKVATSRPDAKDISQLREFGNKCREATEANATSIDQPKGKRPYKKIAGVPLHPKTDKASCKQCAACADKCPVGAIPASQPFITDPDRCISCGHCISVCSTNARHYSGIAYSIIGTLFKAAFSKRKAPCWTAAKPNL